MSISSSAKGVLLGVVGLSALDLLIASQNGPKVFGVITTTPAAWLDAWFDPTKPLIPDLRASSGAGSGGSGSSPGKCVAVVPGGSAFCATVNGNCDKLWGFSKAICEAGQSSYAPNPGYTQPSTTTPPSTSSTAALSA